MLAAVDESADASRVLAAAIETGGSRAICQVLRVFEAPFAERLRGRDVKEATIAAYTAEEEGKAGQKQFIARQKSSGRRGSGYRSSRKSSG